MKCINILLLSSLLVWSCTQEKPKDNRERVTVVADSDSIKGGSLPIQNRDEPIETDHANVAVSNKPCIELIEFITEIESKNWVPDTSRLVRIGRYEELDRKNVTYFQNRPFYPIRFEDSRLFRAYNATIFDRYFDNLDIDLFKGVENIWGYYYRDSEGSDLISDGVIEQWEFSDEAKADEALRQLRQTGTVVYVNTHPYFCRIRNMLIIFQTRAMAFSIDQRALFEKFIEDNALDYLNSQ